MLCAIAGTILAGQALFLQRTAAHTYGDLAALWAWSSLGVSGLCAPLAVPLAWTLHRMRLRDSGAETSMVSLGWGPQGQLRSWLPLLVLTSLLTPLLQGELGPRGQQELGRLVAARTPAATLRSMEPDRAVDLGRHVFGTRTAGGLHRLASPRGPLQLEFDGLVAKAGEPLRFGPGTLRVEGLQISFASGAARLSPGLPWRTDSNAGLWRRHRSGQHGAAALLAQRLGSLLWAPVLWLLVLGAAPAWGREGGFGRAAGLLGLGVMGGALAAPLGAQLPTGPAWLLLAALLPVLPAAVLCALAGRGPLGWKTPSDLFWNHRVHPTLLILGAASGGLFIAGGAALGVALGERGSVPASAVLSEVATGVLPLLAPLAGCLAALGWARHARRSGSLAAWQQLGWGPLRFCRPPLQAGTMLSLIVLLLLGGFGPESRRWMAPEARQGGVFAGTEGGRLVLFPRAELADTIRADTLPPPRLPTRDLWGAEPVWQRLGASTLPLRLERSRRLHLALLAVTATLLGASIGRLRARTGHVVVFLGLGFLLAWQGQLALSALAAAGHLPAWAAGLAPASLLGALSLALLRRRTSQGLPYAASSEGMT